MIELLERFLNGQNINDYNQRTFFKSTKWGYIESQSHNKYLLPAYLRSDKNSSIDR